MKQYKIIDIISSFGIFIDDIIEAKNEFEAIEQILDQIQDNLGNYIEVELEEIEEVSNE